MVLGVGLRLTMVITPGAAGSEMIKIIIIVLHNTAVARHVCTGMA